MAKHKTAKSERLGFITQEDIAIYRGEGGTHLKTYTYLYGKCFAATREHAAVFGEVSSYTLKKGSRIFNFDTIKVNRDEQQTVIPMLTLIDPQATRDWMIERGYDATRNTNSRGVEYVVLNEDIIEEVGRKYNTQYMQINDDNKEPIRGRFMEIVTDQNGNLISASAVNVSADKTRAIKDFYEQHETKKLNKKIKRQQDLRGKRNDTPDINNHIDQDL